MTYLSYEMWSDDTGETSRAKCTSSENVRIPT